MIESQPTVTLVTGGSRSGKSSYALELSARFEHKMFIATAQAMDVEMKKRIDNHKKERGDSYQTIEEPLQVAQALRSLKPDTEIVILDCLTVWLGNLLYHLKQESERDLQIELLLEVVKSPPCHLILVTNEVGMGIIPENELSRQFRDDAGRLNQQIARLADQVVLMVSGIPLKVKG